MRIILWISLWGISVLASSYFIFTTTEALSREKLKNTELEKIVNDLKIEKRKITEKYLKLEDALWDIRQRCIKEL